MNRMVYIFKKRKKHSEYQWILPNKNRILTGKKKTIYSQRNCRRHPTKRSRPHGRIVSQGIQTLKHLRRATLHFQELLIFIKEKKKFSMLFSLTHTHTYEYIYIYIYILIIIILSCHQHGYPWPSLATSLYRQFLRATPHILTEPLYVGSS